MSEAEVETIRAVSVPGAFDLEAVGPEGPSGPAPGEGLCFYFRSARAATDAVRPLGPDVPFSIEGSRVIFTGAIPLDRLGPRAAEDLEYVGEVPDRGHGDGLVLFNKRAADSHQVGVVTARYGVLGDCAVGLWDGGAVRTSHVEFRDARARQVDGANGYDDHATHVAGTIGAHGDPSRGGREKARGMAPAARLLCHVWNRVPEGMEDVAKAGAMCANHSWGPPRGWEMISGAWKWYGNVKVDQREDDLFGRYEGQAIQFDRVVDLHPGLCVFVAAGNDRADAGPVPGGAHRVRENGRWVSSTTPRNADYAIGGYDTIGGFALAKNVVTVGAIKYMEAVPPDPNEITVTSFSSWGPADDGRVKPDLVATGYRLLSPIATGDGLYDKASGTSMATPVATGIAALLADLWVTKRARPPFADEMKAVLIHTAMSPYRHPSARIGWGSLRTDRAAAIVAGESGLLMREELTSAKPEFTWLGKTGALEDVRITLVWIDPPGSANVKPLNDPTPALVHDLDLLVAGPDGDHFPWTLTLTRAGSNSAESVRQDVPNRVDNVERVDVPAADVKPGEWKVTVRIAAFAPKRNKQAFALVLGGLVPR